MSKEHAYAYEAGYRDGSIHYELEHCPACKNVADLQEALAENAKLQNDADLLRAMLRQKRIEKQCCMVENAKLRELVRDLYEDQCDKCDCWKYRDRMRELGVDA